MKPTEHATGAVSHHTNRLVDETSPYLQQHAHNPVDWYPWGPEALQKARREDKPILLSIGYSACHWCHVMERESFENEEIARTMNEHFVNVKVDREERPDLDTLYMSYVQLSTGSGGWPMTVFLTPEQVPFFGGTYFPPDDRYGRPGFSRLLLAVADAYQTKKKEIEEQGPQILKSLQEAGDMNVPPGALNDKVLQTAFESLAHRFDMQRGGFSGAPKFPSSMNLSYCLRYYARSQQAQALQFVELSLEKMANGGMYDQLGGGFHRYSVDDRWLVPHFEKMLYDNALLSRLYLEAYQLTGKPLYRRVTEEVLNYVKREMTSPEGGFYSTQDADSEGQEGKFFIWTAEQVIGALGEQQGTLVCRYYDVTSHGNFEGKNILNIPRSLQEVAQEARIQPDELLKLLEHGRARLFEERERRVKPHRDEKILTAWNGLMLATFVEGFQVLRRRDYLEIARKNAQFILAHLCQDGKLLRTYKNGRAKVNGYLEDYANWIEALILLYEATGERSWLDRAIEFTGAMLKQFWDKKASDFYVTGQEHEKLIVRVKDFYDNATPSGNSVAVLNLLKLSSIVGNQSYREIAQTYLQKMILPLSKYPAGFGYLLSAADFHVGPIREIAVVGRLQDPQTETLLKTIHQRYLPNKVVALLDPDGDESSAELPLLEGKTLLKDKPAAYVCQNYVCKAPVTDGRQLEEMLKN